MAAQGEGVVGRGGLGDVAGSVGRRGGEAVSDLIGELWTMQDGAMRIRKIHKSDVEREAARIAAELATAKVTPAHFWCPRCGANKPAHKHEPSQLGETGRVP